jgi:hypothetical protein
MTPAASAHQVVVDAILRADLDGLVRLVDVLCRDADWEGLVFLRDRSREARERGLQLWPAAEYAEYRLALEAPGLWAGPLVVEGAGRFALGPLWEVAASSHEWAELGGHVPTGPARSLAAHERVLRGEDLSADGSVDRGVLDIPLALQTLEPGYQVATFHADKADFPAPARPALSVRALPPAGSLVEDDESVEALLSLARPWAEQSNGRVKAVVVEGGATRAIAALGRAEALVAEIDGGTALAWMAWAGASGGAYGRRRGGAAGRLAAWWAAAAVAGLEWPMPPEALGDLVARMGWLVWEPPEFNFGWGLHLAGEVPGENLGFAVEAMDARREDEGAAASRPDW